MQRQVADLRTNFSVSGVESVTGATDRVSKASEISYEKVSTAAAASASRLSQIAKAANDAVYKSAMSDSARMVSAAKGGDRLSRVIAERKASEAAATAQASMSALRGAVDNEISQAVNAHAEAIKLAVERANESLEKGINPSVVTGQLLAFTQAQDATMAATKAAAEAVLEKADADRKETESVIAMAAAERAAGEEMKRQATIAKEAASRQAAAAKQAAQAAKQIAVQQAAARAALSSALATSLGRVSFLVGAISKAIRTALSAFALLGKAGVGALRGIATGALKAAHAVGAMAIAIARASWHMVSFTATHAWGALHRVLGGVLDRIETIIKRTAAAGVALVTAANAATTKFAVSSTNETAENARNLVNEAVESRVNSRAIQSYESAGRGMGLDGKDVSATFTHLSDAVIEAARSYDRSTGQFNSETGKLLQQMQIAVFDQHGNLRDANDIYLDLAQKQAYMPPGAREAALKTLFGGTAMKAQPFINSYAFNPDLLAAGNARAARFGTMLSDRDLQLFANYRAAANDLKDSMSGLRTEVARKLAPAFTYLAEQASRFVAYYKDDVATVIAEKVKAISLNVIWMGKILNAGFHLSERWDRAMAQYNSGMARLPIVVRAAQFYLAQIHPHVARMALYMQQAKLLAEDVWRVMTGLDALHFDWLDRIRDRLIEAGHAVRDLATNVYNALAGNDHLVTGIFQRIAEFRNTAIEYVAGTIERIKNALTDGGFDEAFGAWIDKVLTGVTTLAVQLPTYFTQIERWIEEKIHTFRHLWAEFMKVLGGGEGARGQSAAYPWLTDLVSVFDDITERIRTIIGWARTLYKVVSGVFDPILKLFHTDTSHMLMFLGFMRLTGMMGIFSAMAGIFGGWAAIFTRIGTILNGPISAGLRMMAAMIGGEGLAAAVGGGVAMTAGAAGGLFAGAAAVTAGAGYVAWDTYREKRGDYLAEQMQDLRAADERYLAQRAENLRGSESKALAPVNLFVNGDRVAQGQMDQRNIDDALANPMISRTGPATSTFSF